MTAGGTAFPTESGGVRRESTRQGNRLSRAPQITHYSGPALEVQIFGIRKSADTRKALRFFSERRIKTHFVDLMEKPASLGELRRFAQKFGVNALIDKDSRRFDELGLRYAQMSDERWLSRLSEEPLLLRLPLVRSGNNVMIGADETVWRAWMAG
ncbi:MAG TPA: ArsC/Spx/MgsR family protein [Gemmatimonadaceae bacterium]|nr:ArsC/Spx/MgsR family protein [Gemmatimonadaceae bacterium]